MVFLTDIQCRIIGEDDQFLKNYGLERDTLFNYYCFFARFPATYTCIGQSKELSHKFDTVIINTPHALETVKKNDRFYGHPSWTTHELTIEPHGDPHKYFELCQKNNSKHVEVTMIENKITIKMKEEYVSDGVLEIYFTPGNFKISFLKIVRGG